MRAREYSCSVSYCDAAAAEISSKAASLGRAKKAANRLNSWGRYLQPIQQFQRQLANAENKRRNPKRERGKGEEDERNFKRLRVEPQTGISAVIKGICLEEKRQHGF